MLSDIEIARSVKPLNIVDVAKKIGIGEDDLEVFGKYKAKVLASPQKNPKGKLILVTAINPTRAGNGKTTVSIGLADAFQNAGESVCLALREPSLGPVFGVKGGATGGGYSQIIPMEDINLHFTGDFHAITSANNLLCSLIDNHIFQWNKLNIDSEKILFRRCMDVNERALREVECETGYNRHERFIITAASEIMAIMCMATSISDLKQRLGNIMVALNTSGEPIFAKDLNAENSMAILLKDVLKPNLVQTLAGTPALVHCGPFANIAHGCNSVVATKLSMSHADYTVTEAGFGADLGAEKFIDFKCREAGLEPDCVVLVATIRAIKLHGGEANDNLANENLDAIKKGICNLTHHINVLKNVFNAEVVVTLNRFATDTDAEISLVRELLSGTEVVLNEGFLKGGEGAKELAEVVKKVCLAPHKNITYAYNTEDAVEKKMLDIVQKVYGGRNVILTEKAKTALKTIEDFGFSGLPVIMAKTQSSLSADKKLLGEPKNFDVEIKDIEIRSGAGFLVAVCGEMLLMPGLGKCPASENMTIDDNGIISGLF